MTRLSLPGKLLGAAILLAACLLTTAGTALSGGQPPPQKRIQIKIIVDGKEIDLGDARLLEHIEAAQKKAAGDPQPKVLKAIISGNSDKAVVGSITLTPDQPAGAGGAVKPPAKALAFSPDGNIIVSGDGKVFKVVDAKSGKIIGQLDPSKPDTQFEYRFLTQPAPSTPGAHAGIIRYTQSAQAKPDPRIEELVKQAEAIKPGSGAEIRKALQALPKPADVFYLKDPKAMKPMPTLPGVRLDTLSGKKVIILEIEDGKVLQLGEGDLKKHLDKAIRIHLDLDLTRQKADEKAETAHAIEMYYKAIKEKAVDKKAAPPAAPDVEALSRQLERISAELSELRKRLEERKK